MVASGLRPRSAPDGYWDYEKEGPAEVVLGPRDDGGPAPADVSRNFPAVTLLGDAVGQFSPDVPVVLVVPPAFYSAIPRPGTLAAAEEAACRSALQKVVAGRPHSNFINFRVENELTRERTNFIDFGHYRAVIARKMEKGIAESLKVGGGARIEF
jgi:hypothetical protein